MSAQSIAVIVVLAVVLLLIVGFAVRARAKSRRESALRSAFGSEYDRTMDEQGGSRVRAEAELERRRARHAVIQPRELTGESRERYLRDWDRVQARFVDRPRAALDEADELVRAVMSDRGYPVESFEQQTADLSVEHAGALSGYRRAHDVLERPSASTEDVRQAMVSYRQVFVELVGTRADQSATDPRSESGRHAAM